jgi:hypothetical protein
MRFVLISMLAVSATTGCVTEVSLPGTTARAFDVGDFDGDGRDDIVVGYFGSPTFEDIAVLLSNGDATFTRLAVAEVGAIVRDFAVADFDGDGNADFAATYRYADGIGETGVYLGDGAGGFTRSAVLHDPERPSVLVAGDISGDGQIDLVVGGSRDPFPSDPPSSGFGRAVFYAGNGDGTFHLSAPGVRLDELVTFEEPRDLALVPRPGPIDPALGALSVVVTTAKRLEVFILRDLNLAEGGFGRSALHDPDGDFRATASTDLDGDGLHDLVMVDGRGTIHSLVQWQGSTEFPSFPSTLARRRMIPGSPRGVAVGRFTFDAVPDAVVSDHAGAAVRFHAGRLSSISLPGIANDQVHHFEPHGLRRPVGPAPLGVVVADFDGDAQPEVAVLNSGDTTISVIDASP